MLVFYYFGKRCLNLNRNKSNKSNDGGLAQLVQSSLAYKQGRWFESVNAHDKRHKKEFCIITVIGISRCNIRNIAVVVYENMILNAVL